MRERTTPNLTREKKVMYELSESIAQHVHFKVLKSTKHSIQCVKETLGWPLGDTRNPARETVQKRDLEPRERGDGMAGSRNELVPVTGEKTQLERKRHRHTHTRARESPSTIAGQDHEVPFPPWSRTHVQPANSP